MTQAFAMFYECTGLTTLDVSNWTTGNLQYARAMFDQMHNVRVLDVSKWDTHSLTNAWDMFQACKQITQLDMRNWNVTKLTEARCMVFNCDKLQTLYVTNWDTQALTNMDDLYAVFGNCYSLNTVYVGPNFMKNAIPTPGKVSPYGYATGLFHTSQNRQLRIIGTPQAKLKAYNFSGDNRTVTWG